jgi:hypothetical protein
VRIGVAARDGATVGERVALTGAGDAHEDQLDRLALVHHQSKAP